MVCHQSIDDEAAVLNLWQVFKISDLSDMNFDCLQLCHKLPF